MSTKLSQTTPTWINETYLTSLITKIEPDFAGTVEHIIAESATGDGENYASILIRVKVILSTGNCISLIIKTITLDPVANDVLTGQFNVHDKEMFIYEKVLSKYEAVCGFKLTPKVFEVNRASDAIIFEDLSAQGFILANRYNGLNDAHCKLVIESLAKLHAASIVLHTKQTDIFEPFSDGIFNRKIKLLHNFFQAMLQACLEEVETWPGFEEIAKKLNELKENLIERGSSVFDYHSDETFVFLHGDLWTTNIMFTYDEDKNPLEAKLIDFQMSSYGSPVIDLLYFIYTSAVPEIRYNKTEELLKFYSEKLGEALTQLGFKSTKF